MRTRTAFVLLWLLCLAVGTASAADGLVWWEGERPVETNFPGGNPFGVTDQMKQVLSGGDWLEAPAPRASSGSSKRAARRCSGT